MYDWLIVLKKKNLNDVLQLNPLNLCYVSVTLMIIVFCCIYPIIIMFFRIFRIFISLSCVIINASQVATKLHIYFLYFTFPFFLKFSYVCLFKVP